MKLIQQKSIYFVKGKQEKIYEIDLCEMGTDQYVVNFRYGKVGTTLSEGTKTTFPTNKAKALKIFNKAIAEKQSKGYVDSLEEARGTTSVATEKVSLKKETPQSEQPQPKTITLNDDHKNHLLQQLQEYLLTSKTEEETKKPQPSSPPPPQKKSGLLSRLFSKKREEESKQTNTNNQKTTRKTNIDGKRPLNRLIWRVGELRIKEAGPILLALPKPQNSFDQYILVWALGRCGEKEAIPLLSVWEDLPGSDHSHAMLQEALMALSPKQQQQSRSIRILDSFPADFKNIIISSDSKGNPSKEIDKTQIENSIQFIKQFINNELKHKQNAYNTTSQLYLISNHFPIIRAGLLAWLKSAPLQGGGYFKSIRQLYKAAEFRDDAEFFGFINRRIARFYTTFHSKNVWSYTQSTGYVRVSSELKKSTSQFGFSGNTKRYLQNRTWRNLRRKGEVQDLTYVKMAVGVLLAFNDKDAGKPRKESFWKYDRNVRRSVFHEIHYSIWSPYLTFSQILFKHSEVVSLNSAKTAWVYKNKEDAEKPISEEKRAEAFPELWDQLPQGLMHLLVESNCLPVQEMAVKASKANIDKIAQLADNGFIILLLEKALESINYFGLDLAKKHHQANKSNPTKGDLQLVAALFRSNLSEARQLGMQWVEEQPTFFFEETDFIMQLLFTTHEEVQVWFQKTLEQHPIPKSKQQTLIVRSIAKMLTFKADASEAEKTTILQAGKILVQNFSEPLSTIHLDSVQDLLNHELKEVKVFGARILVVHETPANEIPESFILELINEELPEMREVGVQLLGKLSDNDLLEKETLLAELAGSQYVEIRKEVNPIIVKIAQNNPDFGHSIIQKIAPHLLKKEIELGRDADLLDLLMVQLKDHLPAIGQRSQLKFLHSRRGPANELGLYLLQNHCDPEELSIRQIVRLANSETIAIRQWVWTYYDEHLPRVKYEREEAVRLLDSKWDDSRDFAFEFFRKNFTQEDWSPEILVSICDSVNLPVQNFGKELITKFFKEENGEQYLLQLSQHPAPNLQNFATNYLERYASDQPKNIEALEDYFTTILSSVNKSRVAKDRIFAFLHQEGMKSQEMANIIARIISRESATVAIGDKAKCIEILRDLELVWEVETPLKVKKVEVWKR